MNYIIATSSALEILLLLYVAFVDVAIRLIYNEACVVLAVLGIVIHLNSPALLLESLLAGTILFVLLYIFYAKGWMGGGDVKLLVALAIGLPLSAIPQLLVSTALAGGVLALIHLLMRGLPITRPAPPRSCFLRRVYAVERWRHSRRAPLPYGAAIACGGIWTVFSRGF